MSHVATVKVQFTNLTDLQEACRRLNLTLVLNRTTFLGGGGRTCDHVIQSKDLSVYFEAGLVRRDDGQAGWNLAMESDALMLQQLIGTNAEKLKQAYAASAAIRVARMQGYRVTEQVAPNGGIKLQLVK